MPNLSSPVAETDYVREAEDLARDAVPRLSDATRALLKFAQTESRTLDDNHVGTEHLVLGLYALGADSAAAQVLESLGITRDLFVSQLHYDEGPSPAGRIPLTPRARMIVGLAGVEANRLGSELIEPAHVLLGVIRESEKWDATGKAGPHHLRQAALARGVTLADIARGVSEHAD